MRRLTRNEKKTLKSFGADALELRFNERRRLRNAILYLAACDPRWIEFIEREIPNPIKQTDHRRVLQLVESRARWRVLHHYKYFHRQKITEMIFRPDWYFTDDGSLSAG